MHNLTLRRLGSITVTIAASTGVMIFAADIPAEAAGGTGCGPSPACAPQVHETDAPGVNRLTGGTIPTDSVYCNTSLFSACTAAVSANPGVNGQQLNFVPADARTAAENVIEREIADAINFERTQRGLVPLVLSENLTRTQRRAIEMFESDTGLSRTGAPTDCPYSNCDAPKGGYHDDTKWSNTTAFPGFATDLVRARVSGAVAGVSNVSAGWFVNRLVCGSACAGGTNAHRQAVLTYQSTYMSVGVKCAADGTTYMTWAGYSRGSAQATASPSTYQGADITPKVAVAYGHRCPQPGPQNVTAAVSGTSINATAVHTSTPASGNACSATVNGAGSVTAKTFNYQLYNASGTLVATLANYATGNSPVTFTGVADGTYGLEVRFGSSCAPVGSSNGDLPTTRYNLIVGNGGTTPPPGGLQRFVAVEPVRQIDTRSGLGGGRLIAGVARIVTLADVPAGAALVTLNVTAVGAAGHGFVTVYPCSGGRPATSSVNYVTGDIVANQVTVGTAASQVCLYSMTAVDVVIDLAGYFSTAPGGVQVTPAGGRLWDTRTQGGFGDDRVLTLDVSQAPAGTTGVSLNVTATEFAGNGFLTVFPCGGTIPLVSNVNYVTSKTAVANYVTVKVPASRQVCIYSNTTSQVIVDLTGWWTAAATGQVVALTTPTRAVDTRDGVGGPKFTAGETRQIITAQPGLLIVNATATESGAAGWLAVFPCASGWQGTSTVNFDRAHDVANAAIVDASGGVCAIALTPVHLIVDVTARATS